MMGPIQRRQSSWEKEVQWVRMCLCFMADEVGGEEVLKPEVV